MGVCRELGVAWPELFTTTFQVPNIAVFGLDYKFDDTHASFAQHSCAVCPQLGGVCRDNDQGDDLQK